MHARTISQDRWLRFFNRVVYATMAPLYDALDWMTLGAWWRLVRRALDYVPPGGQVLEIGFGPGKLHARLVQQAELCAGLDLAEGMCRFTQRRLRREGLPVRLVRGNVLALPFLCGAFDVVVSTFAFSGFPDGLDALREMARVVRSGGRVVILDMALPSDGNRVGTFWARLWERMGDFLYDQPALMCQAGLEVDAFEEFGPGRHLRAVVGVKSRLL